MDGGKKRKSNMIMNRRQLDPKDFYIKYFRDIENFFKIK
jgi:hypothetical protein